MRRRVLTSAPTGKSGRHFSLLLLFGWSFFLLPVVSLRGQLTEADTLPFAYRLGLSGSRLTGNVERFLLLGNLDLSVVRKVWALRTANAYQYGTFGTVNTENDLFSKNFFYLYPRRRWYPYLMAWLETNKRRNFSFRYQLGPGMSVGLVDTEKHLLKLSATLTYEATMFNDTTFLEAAYNGSERIATWRGTLRIFGRHTLVDDRLRFRFELWGQQSVVSGDNYRLHGEALLELPLSRLFSFRLGYQYNYESIVLAGVRQQDTFLLFGCTFGSLR